MTLKTHKHTIDIYITTPINHMYPNHAKPITIGHEPGEIKYTIGDGIDAHQLGRVLAATPAGTTIDKVEITDVDAVQATARNTAKSTTATTPKTKAKTTAKKSRKHTK